MEIINDRAVSNFKEISLEDRLQIQDQVARYSWAFDSGDLAAYLSRFTADGVLEHPQRDGSPGRYQGHEGIRSFIRDFSDWEDRTWGHQHQFSAMLMERLDETRVQLRAYCNVMRHEFHRQYWPSGPSFRLGTWHATFRKEDYWKIERLQIKMWTATSLGRTGFGQLDRPVDGPGARE